MAIHMTRYKGKKVQGKGEEFMEELRRMVAEHKAKEKKGDSLQRKAASGREVTQNHDSDWNEVTYQEPMRRWVFRKAFKK